MKSKRWQKLIEVVQTFEDDPEFYFEVRYPNGVGFKYETDKFRRRKQ